MILRFSTSNHYSLHQAAEISMVASRAIKDRGTDLISSPATREGILPVALIYGANGAGKTSVWLGLREMQGHVLNSFSKLDPDDDVPNTPYALDSEAETEPTHFDCDFIYNEVRYHYGFEIIGNRFGDEWLYYYPEGSRRTLFYRKYEEDIDFGNSFRGSRLAILSIMRKNCLLVSAGAQAGHPQLKEVFDFFKNRLFFVGPNFGPGDAVSAKDPKIDPRVVTFLGLADTGIVSAKIEFEDTPEETLKAMEKFRQAMQAMIEDAGGGNISPPPTRMPKLLFGHAAAAGETVDLPLEAESRGTIRLISLMDKVFSALDGGKLLFVDEIDASLHSALSIEIIRLFSSKLFNSRGAQLIATTHDTNLLCCDLVRRDQIWFAEKSREGSTHVYPLTDIKTRNTDNIQKGYLQGRFGAIPFFGGLDALMAGEG